MKALEIDSSSVLAKEHAKRNRVMPETQDAASDASSESSILNTVAKHAKRLKTSHRRDCHSEEGQEEAPQSPMDTAAQVETVRALSEL